MSDWRPAKCLTTLKQQLDEQYPTRPTGSDGMIASAAHTQQNPSSDHEPRTDPEGGPGVVCAFDITTDRFTDALAEQLRWMGQRGDRVKYVIYEGRICSARDQWAWRVYRGRDNHYGHIHLSVLPDPDQYDKTTPWPVLGRFTAAAASQPRPIGDPDMIVVYATGNPTALLADGKLTPLKSNAEKDALSAAGVPVKHLTPTQFELIEDVTQR